MLRLILTGMGAFLILVAVILVIWQIQKGGKLVRVTGVITQTARDLETTHDNWARVMVTRPDGTTGEYMTQTRGRFAEEHLRQQVTCYIDPNEKTAGNFLPRCYLEDGNAMNRPGMLRMIIPAALFIVVGIAMIVAGMNVTAG